MYIYAFVRILIILNLKNKQTIKIRTFHKSEEFYYYSIFVCNNMEIKSDNIYTLIMII